MATMSQNDRTIWWIWVFFSAFFLLFSAVLLSEAYKIRGCSNLLRDEGLAAPAEFLSSKKNRRSQHVWEVRFATASGQSIQGKRVAMAHNGKGLPLDPDQVTVVYSPSNLSCWEISKKADVAFPPLAERGLYLLLTSIFGFTFFGLGVVVLAFSSFRLLRR